MKVLLADRNPHPFTGAREDFYAPWWGREVEIGAPRTAEEKHRCGTHTIWPIVGPQEFVELLVKHGLGRFVCIHLISTEVIAAEPKTPGYWFGRGYLFHELSNCPACGTEVSVWESPAKQMVMLDAQTLETHFSSCARAKEYRTEMKFREGVL